MTKRDGHTHPNIIKKPHHADEFILRAIELGFDEIVFTDHMSFTVTGDEHDRIPFGATGDYCLAVRDIARKYKDRIKVLTGIEADYHPTCVDEIKDILSEGSFDVILGSSHLNIKGFGLPFGNMTRSEFAGEVLENYLRAAESGLFDVMTHLDVYRWVFTETERYPLTDDGFTVKTHERLLRHLFRVMEKKNIMLEFNAAPYFKGFSSEGAYPSRDILAIAADYDLRYTYGSDAHTARHVGFAYSEFEKFITSRKG